MIFPRPVGVKGSRKEEVLATREAMRILVTFFPFLFFPQAISLWRVAQLMPFLGYQRAVRVYGNYVKSIGKSLIEASPWRCNTVRFSEVRMVQQIH